MSETPCEVCHCEVRQPWGGRKEGRMMGREGREGGREGGGGALRGGAHRSSEAIFADTGAAVVSRTNHERAVIARGPKDRRWGSVLPGEVNIGSGGGTCGEQDGTRDRVSLHDDVFSRVLFVLEGLPPDMRSADPHDMQVPSIVMKPSSSWTLMRFFCESMSARMLPT